MLDVLHTPQPTNRNVQTFFANSTSLVLGSQNWETWVKPRGIDFVQFFVLAGGGGGGGGCAAGAASTAAGGGGGGSSSQATPIFPAWQLPDILYISVGYGGAGGVGAIAGSATAGGTGVNSYIAIYPDATFVNQIICQANGGVGGGAANGATPGVLGTAGGAGLLTGAPLAGLGYVSQGIVTATTQINIAGQGGIAGNATAAGANLTLPVTGLFVTGGTGGAGVGAVGSTGAAGGSFTALTPAGVFPLQNGGIAPGTTTGTGGNGSNGFLAIPVLRYYYGGTGGASSGGGTVTQSPGAFGNGGAGYYGCGGGGGGGSRILGGSLGGKGGDGIIIATSW